MFDISINIPLEFIESHPILIFFIMFCLLGIVFGLGFLFLYNRISNHLPTQIKEVKKEVKEDIKNLSKEVKEDIKSLSKETTDRLDKINKETTDRLDRITTENRDFQNKIMEAFNKSK